MRDADAAKVEQVAEEAGGLDISSQDKKLIETIADTYADFHQFVSNAPLLTTPEQVAAATQQYNVKLGAAQGAVAKSLASLNARIAQLDSQVENAGRRANIVTLVLCLL